MSSLQSLGLAVKKIDHFSYNPSNVIGKGYSSHVFRGIDDITDESVAIKLVDMKAMKGEVHRMLLQNQIEILKLLRKLPNIIQVYDVYQLKGHTCIVTELCEGGDLAKRIKMKKALTESQAISILKQIINGYRSICSSDVVHRDLKPANILFAGQKIKIADFGFAIKHSELKNVSSYNVGSPVYMPLEALNENIYSFKSDIWAIGIIFFEMLTGKTPWRAKTENDLKRQIKGISIKNLIPVHLSGLSTHFLIKALDVNVATRMTPEEMDRHFSTNNYTQERWTASGNISGNSPVNVQNNSILFRTNVFKTRVASHERQQPIDSSIGKDIQNGPKTFRKISLLGYNEKYNGNHQQLVRTTANLGLVNKLPAVNSINYKKISNQLISQIHFCRFLYKLTQRIANLQNPGVPKKLTEAIATLIALKLKEIMNLRMLTSKTASLFRKTKEYQRIYNVADQYKFKYARLFESTDCCELENLQATTSFRNSANINLAAPMSLGCSNAISELGRQLDESINILYSLIANELSIQDIEGLSKEIIMLDYFVTLKQLLSLLSRNDMEMFHQRSKIEAIVQSRPAKTITLQHVSAIKAKLKSVAQLIDML